MKSKLVPLLAVACLISLVIVSAPRAQIIPPPPEWIDSQLFAGEEIVVHMSHDLAIELVVDRPFTDKERVFLVDEATGKKHPLPNGAAVRAQGSVVLSREPNPDNKIVTRVRWRYVDTMFQFSRKVYPTRPLR